MSIYRRLRELEREGGRAVLCTIVRTRGSVPRHAGAKMLVQPDGSIVGTIGGGELERRTIASALDVLAAGGTRIVSYSLHDPDSGDAGVCGGEVEIFMEALSTSPTLVVIGAGHVGRAVVHLGKWLGFRLVVSDDRPEYCTPEATPGADEYVCAPMSDLPGRLRFDARTYIVLTTRGAPLDIEGLPALLQVPHAYLGVIGSRRRWRTAFQELEHKGIARERLESVHSPIGLELHAETPEEIALSILAEIVKVRNKASGRAMKSGGESGTA